MSNINITKKRLLLLTSMTISVGLIRSVAVIAGPVGSVRIAEEADERSVAGHQSVFSFVIEANKDPYGLIDQLYEGWATEGGNNPFLVPPVERLTKNMVEKGLISPLTGMEIKVLQTDHLHILRIQVLNRGQTVFEIDCEKTYRDGESMKGHVVVSILAEGQEPSFLGSALAQAIFDCCTHRK